MESENIRLDADDDALYEMENSPANEGRTPYSSDEEASHEDEGLFPGDVGELCLDARKALATLLYRRYVCEAFEPERFKLISNHAREVEVRLNELFLTLRLSDRYGTALVVPVEVDGASPVPILKRNVALKRESVLLIIMLRISQHKQETDGRDVWFAERDDMEAYLKNSLYPDELDAERVRSATAMAISELCEQGYLRMANQAAERYRITPLLPTVFTLDAACELRDRLLSENANGGESNMTESEEPLDESVREGEAHAD